MQMEVLPSPVACSNFQKTEKRHQYASSNNRGVVGEVGIYIGICLYCYIMYYVVVHSVL
jgi:hypothetical protein